MESTLQWLSEEEGILTVSLQGKQKMRFRVYALGEEEAELKPEWVEIVETIDINENMQEKVIEEMTKCILESFLLMSNEGFEETSIVERNGTDVAQILNSTKVVEKLYSEYMMRRSLPQATRFVHNSDNLKLFDNEDSIFCENKERTFICKLLPYTEEASGVRCFYLYEVEVKEGERNKGIATACLQELFERLTEQGEVVVYLQVGSYNEPALHLYEKLGFEISEELCYYALTEQEEQSSFNGTGTKG